MRRRGIVLAAIAIVAGFIASLPRVCAEGPNDSMARGSSGACMDRYNTLVTRAETSLVKGDRRAAIDSLLSARVQLRRCQELEERERGAVALALETSESACVD